MKKLPAIKRRVGSAAVMIILAGVAVFRLPDCWTLAVIIPLTMLLMLEFYKLEASAGFTNFRCFGTFGAVMLVVMAWLAAWQGKPPGESDSVILFLVTVAVFVRQFPQKHNPHPLQTIGGTLFGVLYIGLLFSFITKLLLFNRPVDFPESIYMPGRWLVLYAIFSAKFTDIGAYLVGCAIGRHKLFPRISPAKSWEGVFGGIVVSTAAGVYFVHLLSDTFVPLGLTPLRAIPLGILLAICAIVGDLVESMFKRAAAIKDSGGTIPGMGGILDVIDSILFTLPTLYVYLYFTTIF